MFINNQRGAINVFIGKVTVVVVKNSFNKTIRR